MHDPINKRIKGYTKNIHDIVLRSQLTIDIPINMYIGYACNTSN